MSQLSVDSIDKIFLSVDKSPSNFDRNYPLLQKALSVSLNLKDTIRIIRSYQKIADVLWFKSIYGESENYYFKSLALLDSSKYPKEYAYALYSIGWIECIQKTKFEKITFLKRALNISGLVKDTYDIARFSNAISGTYMNLYNKDTTKKYFIDSAIRPLVSAINLLGSEKKWKTLSGKMYSNLANEYLLKNDIPSAYRSVNTAISNLDTNNHRRSFLISILYKCQILRKMNQKDSAYLLLKRYFNSIESINDNEVLRDFYYLLYEIEKENKNFNKALFYFEKYQNKYELISKELLSVKFEELEANKELIRKERSILNLQKQAEVQKFKNQQKTYIILAFIIILLIIMISLNKLYIKNKQIKKLHSDVLNQNKIVEQKNKDIMDSITYASRIQRALITSDEYIQKHFLEESYFQNYFILYIPKDIVSGDFYWANVNYLHPQQPHYIAVCDSTGHGVPGAFMSLLNINYLTEAVQEKQCYYPNEILNYVRKKLIENLNYDEQQKDGMDASIILFDKTFKQTQKIFYALANQQMVLIRNNQFSQILSGDKMPVGSSHNPHDFNLYSIQLQKGDWLYIYTDGYKDQFGGEKGKRIMNKNFIELLLNIVNLNADEQKVYLNNFFNEWKKGYEQTDDVTVIGIMI